MFGQIVLDGERYLVDGEELHCGQVCEVLVCDGLDGFRPKWVETRFERNGDNEGYFVGLWGYNVPGLFVRIMA